MPDIVSFDILYPSTPDPYQRDGIRALTSTGLLITDDWYAYYDPYGLSRDSIDYQRDIPLGGLNDVTGVFLGELNGDSTVVYRRALRTPDIEHDESLITDSSYTVFLYLQWGEYMQPDYSFWQSENFQIII